MTKKEREKAIFANYGYSENNLTQIGCEIDFLTGWRMVEDHVAAREEISFADRTGLDYNVAEKIALVHSELSEGLEAYRKSLMDDHLPKRAGMEVELADAVIRIMGIAHRLGYNIPQAILEKAAYNDTRADHKDRSGPHGKKF